MTENRPSESEQESRLRTMLTAHAHWPWFFSGAGVALGVAGIAVAVILFLVSSGGTNGVLPTPTVEVRRMTLIAGQNPVPQGGTTTITAIPEGEEPCTPTTIVWQTDGGKLDVDSTPTQRLVVNWTATQEFFDVRITATERDCRGSLSATGRIVIQVVAARP